MTEKPENQNALFTVEWTHRLRFTTNAFSGNSPLTDLISELNPVKIIVFIDDGVSSTNPSIHSSIKEWAQHADISCCDTVSVTGGEQAKNSFKEVKKILKAINDNQLCRKSCILVIGGGAVLDAVGFAASIAHRGIPLIRMPSTTLSACDSGLGVKNGMNYFGKKNFLGVFDPPYAVINDLSLLNTLEQRHWISGLSEAVKVSLIKDKSLFENIESVQKELLARDAPSMNGIVAKSAKLHMNHITQSGDPFEKLEIRPLDFGHWSAHKLEQLTNYAITHGEAVAIGVALDATCSKLLGHLDDGVCLRIVSLLQSLELPTMHPELRNEDLLHGLDEFREHIGGQLTLLMLKDIGKPIEIHELDSKIIRQAIDELM